MVNSCKFCFQNIILLFALVINLVIQLKSSLVFRISLRSSGSRLQIVIAIHAEHPSIMLVSSTAVSGFPGGYRIYVRHSKYDKINWKPYMRV